MPLLTSDIKDFVRANRLGFVATVSPEGKPSLSPKGTMSVWDDQHLIFADIRSPGTIKNLETNPSIEINIVDVFIRKGYRFKGKASIVTKGPLFDRMLASYGDSISQYPVRNIVLVKVETVLAVCSPIYDTGATEEAVEKKYIDYWQSVHPREKML